MQIAVKPVGDGAVKSSLCAGIIAALPMWFGRPEAHARYLREIVDRDAFAVSLDGGTRGLIAVEYQFAITCNIWWLGVQPSAHRRGLGRALMERAAEHARAHGCHRLAVETVSPRTRSAEYDATRR